MTKQCTSCKETKDTGEFWVNKSGRTRDGLFAYCKPCGKAKSRGFYAKNKEHCYAYAREYRAKNRELMNAKQRIARPLKMATNATFKLSVALRVRLHRALRGNYRSGSAVRDLGCSIDELRAHLEARFQPGMSWGNWSRHGWHIDHIKPLASFDLSRREQFLVANHYTNLQPMWAADNFRKGARQCP
jgi:predicted RNA-binding protein YlxR (DUF448 family)